DVYAARYTLVPGEAELEILSFRVRASGPKPQLSIRQTDVPHSEEGALKGHRKAYFGDGFVDAAIYDRYRLTPGIEVAGPAIVEERESTTIVFPGDTLTVDDAGNLRIAIAVASKGMDLVTPDMTKAQAIEKIESDPI